MKMAELDTLKAAIKRAHELEEMIEYRDSLLREIAHCRDAMKMIAPYCHEGSPVNITYAYFTGRLNAAVLKLIECEEER